jgi:xylulokinase
MPKPLWAEQNPSDWWAGVQTCLKELDLSKLDGIGLTGQMHGAVFLDGNDEVIRPAILWNDQRTVEECQDIEDAVGRDRVRQITCNPPLTGFQLPKVLWLRKHEPEAFARLRRVLLPKDFIRLKLSGAHATEVSDASGTGLLDVPNRRWSEEIARALHLDRDLFPPCSESFDVTAKTANGTPIVGGAGDQAAGAVGTGAVGQGIVSVSVGTSGVVFATLDAPVEEKHGALHTFCHANGRWHAMGVMLSCGGALQWYVDAVSREGNVADALRSAATAPAGANGLTFLPYLSGERSPHNDPSARGVWAGLTLSHSAADMARSVLEGVTFGLKDSMDRLVEMGAECRQIRVTGGGARSSFWMQTMADVFGVECRSMAMEEGPAYGSALLAGVGAGVWKTVGEACAATVRPKALFSPSGQDYSRALSRYRSLYPALEEWMAQAAGQ